MDERLGIGYGVVGETGAQTAMVVYNAIPIACVTVRESIAQIFFEEL